MPAETRMALHVRTPVSLLCLPLLCLAIAATAHGEVLFRWDQAQVPSRDSLGVAALVVPASNGAAVKSALTQGYSVYLEVEAKALAGLVLPRDGVAGVLVKGTATREQLALLRQRIASPRIVVRTLEERGKWPHVRTNWVTNNKGVLQVSSRTAQPWIENNAALIRLARLTQPGVTPILTYQWQPITASDKDDGPALEHYLVAIAEAGSFGADLVLPLHARFQQHLLLGLPQARAWWDEIHDYATFYASNLPARYEPMARIGVVTAADPMRWFEVMNLLARHNLHFEPIPQDTLAKRDLSALAVLIVLDAPPARLVDTLAAFAQKGGTLVLAGVKGTFPWQTATPVAKADTHLTYPSGQGPSGHGPSGQGRVVELLQPVANPDTFALEIRQLLGRDQRTIDLWNGITILTGLYAAPQDGPVLLTTLNYAQQAQPVQMRLRGTFTAVQYESPEEKVTRLPFQLRDGYTEFVVPALRVGGRLFLTRDAGSN